MFRTDKEKILNDYKNYHNPRFPDTFRWDKEALLGFIDYILENQPTLNRDKVMEILIRFDVKPSYAQTAVYNQSIGGFRQKITDAICSLSLPTDADQFTKGYEQGLEHGKNESLPTLSEGEIDKLWERFSFVHESTDEDFTVRLMTKPQFELFVKELTKPKEE
jgi:hypothetical protein